MPMIDRSVSVGLEKTSIHPSTQKHRNTSSSWAGRGEGDDSRVAGGLTVLILRFLKEAELGSKISKQKSKIARERAQNDAAVDTISCHIF
jgi:hypothetical protein